MSICQSVSHQNPSDLRFQVYLIFDILDMLYLLCIRIRAFITTYLQFINLVDY